MRKASLDKNVIGLKVGQPVLGLNGQVLLGKGTEITEHFIERLKFFGYSYIYVDDGLLDDVVPDELISTKTRIQITTSIKEVTENFRMSSRLNLLKFKKVMNLIFGEVLNNKGVLASLTDIRTSDPNDYLFNHSINVTALSVLIGLHMYYPENKLYELGTGVLLHDIGKTTLPDKFIITPAEDLSVDEVKLYQQHTWNGYEILRSNPEIKLVSAAIALQHHEHYDGMGFPRSEKGINILEYARIAAIADAYDNLSNDRGTRKKLPANKVSEYLQSKSGTHFDPKIVDRFIQKIALYPQGTKILLNDGKSGFVIRQNSNNHKPIVRLFWKDGRDLPRPEEEDLLKNTSLSIIEVLE